MVRRSVLFTPGDRLEMLRNAPESGADVVVYDLEDAIAPAHKAEARETVAEVLCDPSFDPDCELCVRVNPIGDGAATDVEALFGDTDTVGLDSVMLPKVTGPADVERLQEHIGTYGGNVPVLALVENASSVLLAADIAAVSWTDALVFGAEDFAVDIGATRTESGEEVAHARGEIVFAAGAHDVDAIDAVVTDLDDSSVLREDAAFANQIGFDGKLAIHPAQVDTINDAFSPSADELAWAESILEASQTIDLDIQGVFEVDGEMVDKPLLEQARTIVARAPSDSDSE